MILVPVKNLATAKQRLGSVLTQEQRTELARAMLKDVFDALAGVPGKPTVGIVTGDAFATRLARQHGFEIIADADNPGESEAIAMATQEAEKRGAEFTLVIPGDVPLITAEEVAAVLNAAPPQGSVLVRAADGRGTNAILRRPAALFPCRFGNDSFQPHQAAARATLKTCVVLDGLPGIALDVDRPEDLAALLDADSRTRTQRLLRQWNLGATLSRAAGL
jgi:2-phospho-L-lactate/phosphoenolpyruvate guanylyltransferase